jgi:hypothetical protein
MDTHVGAWRPALDPESPHTVNGIPVVLESGRR